MTLTHGSLFTGIGMIDYGLSLAGFETKWQVEKDEYCLAVLRKYWPDVPKFKDVRDCGRHNLEPVDIISGGFPCQNISEAGIMEGLGELDRPTDRSGLWYQYHRIIEELRPPWVLVENVPRLLHRWDGDRVLSDLERADYTWAAVMVGASDFGAPHKRQRTWIVGCRHDPHSDNVFDTPMDPGGLLPAVQRAIEESRAEWERTKLELVSGDGSAGRSPEQQAQDYDAIVREFYGNPCWQEQSRAIGNSVVPVVPALIGSFVRAVEEMYARTDAS
jgi:DNA (cytosine-5)-methyltransferase 1